MEVIIQLDIANKIKILFLNIKDIKSEGLNMDKSSLAKRMKQYESVSRSTLVRRMPVIIRLDGRSFHTFTKGFKRPFDDVWSYVKI